ncbi:hypothetical protein TNCV_2232311 [Trichonephila clavipes]|nr:hypothetical protein TNCV_2232311 [Trichonephila clavipes]
MNSSPSAIEEPRVEELTHVKSDESQSPPRRRGVVAGADWKYTRIYNPQRRLRVLVERCRKDSSQKYAQLFRRTFQC